MLYPEFDELLAFKSRKSADFFLSKKGVKSIVPGRHHSPFRGQGLEFDSVREYVPGDDIRSIDWRVTARTGAPHLKVFKEERERQVLICVDRNASMRFGTRHTFKSVQAARIAAYLGWQAISHHDRVGACLFGDVPAGIEYFPPKKNRKSFISLLKALASPQDTDHLESLGDLLTHVHAAAHTGSLIYVISDFLGEPIHAPQEALLNGLNQRCDLVFVAVNDRADQDLFSCGMLNFRHLGIDVPLNTDDPAGLKRYKADWEHKRQTLYQQVSKFKIPLLELTTESDVQRDLPMGLKSLVRRRRG